MSDVTAAPSESALTRTNALEVGRVSKFYFADDVFVHALSEISLDIREHEFVSIIGPSGCGKSTLLKILCGLDKPTAGTVSFQGKTPAEARKLLGYVPQHDHLLPWRTVASNCSARPRLRGRRGKAARERVSEYLASSVSRSQRTSIRVNCRGACASGLRSHARSRTTPSSS